MGKESKRFFAAGLIALTLTTGGYAVKDNVNSESKPQSSSSTTTSNSTSSELESSLVSETYSSTPKPEVSSLAEIVSSRVVSSKPEVVVSSLPEVYSTSSEFAEMENVTVIEYGKSELGRPLEAMLIQPTKEVKKTVLLTFELHGYEDSYPKDGQVLVDLGKALIKYFAENPDQLGNTALYIIPSANPDGLIDGTTSNGFGRGQASGIDINRDFSYNWEKEYSSRYKTLFPFSCPESRALRDLVLKIKPDKVVDFHGWLHTSYGNKDICRLFNNLDVYWSNVLGTPGYFTSWAGKQTNQNGEKIRVALIELPDPKSSPTNPQKIIQAITYLCNQ